MIEKKLPAVPQKDYPYFVPEVIWADRCHESRLKKHPLFYVTGAAMIGTERNKNNDEDDEKRACRWVAICTEHELFLGFFVLDMARALMQYGSLSVGFNAGRVACIFIPDYRPP